jgi:predicted O-methyltransferase YrrM
MTKQMPSRAWRKAFKKFRDQVSTLAGRPRGFFTPYDWAGQVAALHPPYPWIETLFENSDWLSHLEAMGSHRDTFRRFGSVPIDPRTAGSRMFGVLDGAAAYAAVSRFAPSRIIEIGSGDSTYFLAAAARELPHSVEITCIDPAPRREIDALPVKLERRLVSTADVSRCAELERNDILFIDSSHIMLPGMDVDIEFNWMFPALKPGVIVHVHDVFLPDPYPASWTQRNYNEQQALVGWIGGGFFDVVYPGHFVATRMSDRVESVFGDDYPDQLHRVGSLWLRRSNQPRHI